MLDDGHDPVSNVKKLKSTTALSPFRTQDARFDFLHVDLVGPLPPSRGYSYLLTCVDRYTRWPEAIPLSSITAEAVAHAFLHGWISHFGVPSTIVSDRGRQFESKLWKNLMALLGSRKARTTAYHPQTNGMVERFHRQLKAALKAQPNPASWVDALPLVLLGIRTALKEDLSATAAEMVHGTTLRLPGEFFQPSDTKSVIDPTDYVSQLKTRMQCVRPTPPRTVQRDTQVPQALATTTHVFVRHDAVRKPLQSPYDGPYLVLERTDKFFKLNIKGREDTVSIDRLKPAYLDIDSHPNPPPQSQTHSHSITAVIRPGRQVHWSPTIATYVS